MFESMHDVRQANRDRGHHFFEPDTMRFFKSRVSDTLHGGRFFVTSERPPHGPRSYSVRAALPDGEVETVAGYGFCGFNTYNAAQGAAGRLAVAQLVVVEGSETGGPKSFSVVARWPAGEDVFIFWTYDRGKAESFVGGG